ncbi:MAG: hypothetical protein JSU63_01180 [Phycisphaerales bacterium]|nr:MAG: hypothetical protein JSU63_01180 [Phycisphaerales bacterium]
MALKPYALALAILLIGGCGVQMPVEPADCADDGSSTGGQQLLVPDDQVSPAPGQEDANFAADSGDSLEPSTTPAPLTTSDTVDDPTVDELTTPGVDGALPNVFGDHTLQVLDTPNFYDLLDVVLDNLLGDALAPSQVDGGFSYLELLCRDNELPDSYCRQRYGN